MREFDILDQHTIVCRHRPGLRFGQVVATVGLLGKGELGRSVWDMEGAEFTASFQRFATDLGRSDSKTTKAASP